MEKKKVPLAQSNYIFVLVIDAISKTLAKPRPSLQFFQNKIILDKTHMTIRAVILLGRS